MEATGLSLGKSVLDGALGYAQSAVAEEVALQLGIQQDQAFIRDELEMMLAFLMAAHEERDEHKVTKTWVNQVRDVAYEAEDCLQDFAVRLGKPSWWHIPCMLLERRRVAKLMKELRAKVEDVSQRNVRYRLIKGSGSKATTSVGESNMASETMSSTEEARRQHEKAKVNLIQLINKKDDNLRVISVWGTSGVPGETSIIKMAYDDLERKKKFECHAWIRIMHPFNQTEFVQSIIQQFYINSLEEATKTKQKLAPGAQDLWRMWMLNEDSLVDEFKKVLNEKSYLVVLSDLSSMEEWDQIKTCFPKNKNGSRLIVCTEQVKVASLCVGSTALPEHKQLYVDQTLYAFYEKGSQGGTDSMEEGSSSNTKDTIDSENSMNGKRLVHMESTLAALKESQLIGRDKEKSDIIKMISNRNTQEFEVISICGMGGIGKTTLVKNIYQNQDLVAKFDKRACVTIKRPFNHNDLISSLATELDDKKVSSNRNDLLSSLPTKKEDKKEDPVNRLARLLGGKKYLIVLDDISSTTECDAIMPHFPKTETASRIIVTTRLENIAKHCSKKDKNIYKLEFLGDKGAHDLFTEKVFGAVTCLDEQDPELAKEAKLILKKCNGLPLAIVTIGGFLAKQPTNVMEWRKLNERISTELETNAELRRIPNVLIKSYDGLPYQLKSCFLYLSIFPEGYNISWKRLVRRWIAEGYPSEVRGQSMMERADVYFMELTERGMILPSQQSVLSRKKIDSCKLHDLMREISISKSTEENFVLRLEEGCSLNTHGTVRHLAISSNWKGDKGEFESTVDLSRIRSLTVFAMWRPFFISDKMRVLRVLDLENTEYLCDHDLEQIGKLLHLKYLSLRECNNIFHLPDSLGNLKQLQTLDIKGTLIINLPKTIINLRKLQYIHAGNKDFPSYEGFASDSPKRLPKKLCLITFFSVFFCSACCGCVPLLHGENGPSRGDLCTAFCCNIIPLILRELKGYGVVLPRGFRKLTALHTLSSVNIGCREGMLQEMKRLTKLRRLAVTGIKKKNCREFCSALDDLSRLESLSLQSTGEPGLHGCLDGMFSPPKSLQSLRLHGNLVRLPEWIEGLHNIVKLKLEKTKLSESDASVRVLGKLPNLAILRLLEDSFVGEELRLTFHGDELFQSLTVLHLNRIKFLYSVEFKEGAMPMLELLLFREGDSSSTSLSGLSSLPSLKELLLEGGYAGCSLEELQEVLARNPNKPVLKRS